MLSKMAFQRVAVAGASGNLGPSVIEKLVAAGFDVTILSRKSSSAASISGPKTVAVDYDSLESVTAALKGHDAFISLVPNHESQPALIDAAIAAGVKRFIPSEFGSNVVGSAKTAQLPVFAGKLSTQKHLQAKAGQIEWTLIMTGLFLDFGLNFGVGVNVKGSAPTPVYDGGDVKFSVTRCPAIGDAVVGVLRHPEQTRNRGVYVQEAALTQNQLLAAAERLKPGLKLARQPVVLADLEKESYAKLQGGKPEDIKSAMFGFIVVSLFDPECKAMWADKNDSELLGVKQISQAEIDEEIVKHL